MKTRIAIGLCIAVLAIFMIGLVQTQLEAQTDTNALWKQVEEAQNKGLPKTAIKSLKQIYKVALKEKKYGEALRALSMRIVLESNIKGNKPEVKVNMLKAEIKKADPEMKPLMKTILAQWYWHYYSRNKWRFVNRTRTADMKEDDFTTWDLPKIFNEISSIYQDLLRQEAALKKLKLSDFEDVLDKGNLSPALRPTLFDFIAFKALEFYTSGEQAGAYPEDAFVIKASSGAFDEAHRFIQYTPETTDRKSPKYLAIKIYQKLLKFHLDGDNTAPFLDADILRLNYIYNVAVGDDKNTIYIKRMKEIIDNYPQSPYASLAYYYWAQQIYNDGDYVRAYNLATKGKSLHPDSYGAIRCKSLLNNITAKSLSIKEERVYYPGAESKLQVNYKNIDTLTLRVIPENWKDYLDRDKSIFHPDEKKINALLKKKPAAEVIIPLTPTKDYKVKQTLIDLPPLKQGFYRVFASYKDDFSRTGNCIEQCFVWVSSLAVVTREHEGQVSGFVLDGQNGSPVKGAAVIAYGFKDWNNKQFRLAHSTTTDEQGTYSFKINPDKWRQVRIYARDNRGAEYIDPQEFYPYRGSVEQPYESTVFFTDRALYRPGQMIHFKGIVVDVDKKGKDYHVIAQRKVTVRFKDVNGQEIARQTLTSNDFGSFSGTFNAPTDRLTGAMSIVADSPRGSAQVRVEEYKRPKFTVEVKVPDKGYRLGEKVSVTGEAMAYTGAAIDGANVTYRVVREVRMPYWWFYYYRGRSFESREISHGTTTTDTKGKFTITFNALPDEKISRKDEPTFIYRIYADVTDSAGETRSDEKSIRLGYTAMEATMNAEKWQQAGTPVTITVRTATLDGAPVKGDGSIEVFRLTQPEKPVRPGFAQSPGKDARKKFSSDYKIWPAGKIAAHTNFTTTGEGKSNVKFKLKAGPYRAVLTSKDRYGKKVSAQLPFIVCDETAKRFAVKLPDYFVEEAQVLEVGDTYKALWGTGYRQGRAFVEIFQNNVPLKRYWTDSGSTQGRIKIPVSEKMRGGFTVMTTFVHENKLFTHNSTVSVPWSNKNLQVTLETFRSKLKPGQEETWTLLVKGPGAQQRAAELVATLYDESLDAFYPHRWSTLMNFFGHNYTSFNQRFSNVDQDFYAWISNWNSSVHVPQRKYVNFIYEIVQSFYGYEYSKSKKVSRQSSGEMMCEDAAAPAPACAKPATGFAAEPEEERKEKSPKNGGRDKDKGGEESGKAAKKMDVKARKNLNETAFFFPHLITEKDGTVKITFTMPEALTKWHFMAVAHGKGMESGFVEGHTVTQKDLMVQPNPPRFFREGDILEFSVKVTNMVEKDLKGTVRLTFFSPSSDQSLDKALGNVTIDKEITIPAKQSKSCSWRIQVPDGMKVAGFRAMAQAGNKKDGEQGVIPVLSRRIFVSESIPLWVRGPGEKNFSFKKLVNSKDSDTLVNEGFTVQVSSNPAWYAVQALPYLMEFPHECSEQVFNRLYANALAKNIADSDPRIRSVFNKWKEEQPDALLSNLEKNEHLKSVFLLETPWVLQAKSESQAKRHIGILFEDERMQRELASAHNKLKNMQLNDGSWPWFPGGYPNTYITLYVTTGFGRLKHMNVKGVQYDCALKALNHLDGWVVKVYEDIKKHGHLKENNLSSTIALYLYGRSFFLKEKPIPGKTKVAVDYFLGQGKQYWLKLNSRMSQGHLALALNRFGDKKTAKDIMTSMKERSQTDEEMGMFWSEGEISWWWNRAPIETQALMIEAFDEVMNDPKAVEECKVWLLKQKQTQDWKTTKATSDAIYGLLRKGENLLSSDKLVEVTLGGVTVKPEKVEAGTGFYEQRYDGEEVKPEFGEITMKKVDKGIAWGGAHWQYLEDISKVTPHTQSPLKLKKTVFVQKNTKSGPVISPVKSALAVGDLLKIRVELRVDRDMEYIHMRDDRGSGTEPVNVLSRYKYQDGLRYYESTKDSATHFYIDYLPKGTYVFEYPLRVVNRGKYQNGIAHIECMYAPEFSSHSGSALLEVK